MGIANTRWKATYIHGTEEYTVNSVAEPDYLVACHLCEEDARLIAAAPELLDACWELLFMHCNRCLCHTCPEKECHPTCAYLKFRSIIARATGKDVKA